MKIKNKEIKKILVNGLTGSLLLNSVPFNSFANVNNIDNSLIVNLNEENSSEISYELLMGLMGIGVSFGLSSPKDEAEYWDYTSSLKRHLHLLDENYLQELNNTINNWKINNKPSDEKEPLKVPYIPELNSLFDKVGKELSAKYSYLGASVLNVPIYRKSEYYDYLSFAKSIPMYRITPNVIRDINTPYGTYSFRHTPWSSTSGIIEMSQDNFATSTAVCNLAPYQDVYVAVYLDTNHTYSSKTYLHSITYSPQGNNGAGVAIERKTEYQLSATGAINKTQINYSPTEPDIVDDEIVLPYLPQIKIPDIDTVPGYNEDLDITPPFNVIMPEGYTESSMVEKAEQSKDITDIENARDLVNKLEESELKNELQNRLDAIVPNTTVSSNSSTANLDIYLKSLSSISMALDTNSITFNDFSLIEDTVKENAVTVTITSSLPYELNSYLIQEITSLDDTPKTLDKSILNIKANGTDTYNTFEDIGTTPIMLLDNQNPGETNNHGIDFKLDSDVPYEDGNYKTVIKFEAKQK